MKIWWLIAFCILLGSQSYAQSCATPILVDLSAAPEGSKTVSGSRNGDCCSGNNCISFTIKVNPETDLINFTADQITGASFYTVNCGPLIPIGTPACIAGQSIIEISFCKPGNNSVDYTITALQAVKGSDDLYLRQGCTGTMSVSGLQASSTVWTSVYPGATGAYNSYLSQASGATTVTVTPGANAPAYIDYKVSGTQTSACASIKSDIIRVYTYAPLSVSLTPANPVSCSGTPVTLTATVSGGNGPYTYAWSNGATSSSISVSTGGTYSVSVNDQLTACGPVTKQATLTVYVPVAPTAANRVICPGETATLTAAAPGGPYQWYDAPVNGNLLSSSVSYVTPVLANSKTYYVQTTFNGCTSPRAAVTVTVDPYPAKPAITTN